MKPINFVIIFLSVLFVFNNAFSQETSENDQEKENTEATDKEKTDETSKASEEGSTEEASDDSASASPSNSRVEKIEVTGSYIKRIDLAGPSPLVTIDKEAFAVVGSQTVADVLKEKSFFDGVDSEAFVNFHGQTEADTLVLLNGMRLPKTAGGTAVNIDFIPNSAVSKVEILKDGASALYGSEAIAGVMNIVTKKDFDGASVDFRYTYPEIGKNQEANVVASYGHNFSKGNVLGVIQYRDTEPVVWDDLGAGVADNALAGTPFSSPANLLEGGNWFRSADCPASSIATARGGFCGYDYLRFRNFAAGNDKQHLSALFTSKYDVSADLGLKFTAVYTRRTWKRENNPIPIQMTVPQAVANGWAAGGRILDANGNQANFTSDPTLFFMAEDELGINIRERLAQSVTLQTGATGYFLDTWNWNFDAAYGLTAFRDDQLSGQGDEQAIQNRINANTFNPFLPAGSKDSLAAEKVNPWFEHESDVFDVKAVTAGEIYDLGNLLDGAGPLSMAIGTEATWESFSFTNDPLSLAGVPIGVSETNQEGDRAVQSGFVEFTAYPSKRLEFQLAGRFDQYSDVGSTFNPKIASSFKVSKEMLLRASYGTAFKAPDLLSVNQGAATAQDIFRDESICQANGENDPDCNGKTFNVTTSGSKDLRPETAYHINVGTVIQPIKRLSFTVDYWQANGVDGLSEVDASTATLWEYRFGNQFVRDLGIIIDRDGSGNITNFFLPVRVNSGSFRVRGLDFSLSYDFTLDIPWLGKFKSLLTSEHTQALHGGSNSGPGAPFIAAYDLDWKNTTALSLVQDKGLYRFAVRSQAGGDKDTDQNVGVGRGSVPSFTVYDFHYQYTGDWGGKISFGVKNLLDSRLPANDLDGFYIISSRNFNPVGRRFYMGYGHEF